MLKTILVTTLTTTTVVAMGLSLPAATPGTSGDTLTAATPTYNEHIAQLLFDNCASCHRPNQIAPMSLLSYQDARKWAMSDWERAGVRENCSRKIGLPDTQSRRKIVELRRIAATT